MTIKKYSIGSHLDIFKIPNFFFKWDWGLNLGLSACTAGVLPLESHLQSILLVTL
jgi:hypothetical protein